MDEPMRGELTKDDRTWGMLCHLSTFSGYVIPLGNIIAPLVIWLVKKDESGFVDHHGREVLNFQISIFIYLVICAVLMLTVIGIPVAIAFGIVLVIGELVLTIVAAIKANDGDYYRYPMAMRIL